MANEFRALNLIPEYFGDKRDYWWNLGFLELMSKGSRTIARKTFSALNAASAISIATVVINC
jgi:hypothetical protein